MTGQTMTALALANEVRTERAQVLRALRQREMDLADALLEPSLDRMDLRELARHLPWRAKGRTRAAETREGSRWLQRIAPSSSRTVGSLTMRERKNLAALVSVAHT